MYRNIYYNNRRKQVHLWTWDEDGNRICKTEPFKPYIMLEHSKGRDGKSIYGSSLKKREFTNNSERYEFVKSCGIKRLFNNLNVQQQYLIDRYYEEYQSESFNQFPLKIFMFDIEVYSPDEFPEADQANHPINVITIYDTLSNMYYTFGTGGDYYTDRDDVKYVKCSDEVDLLKTFTRFWRKDFPDIVCGYNSDGFDIPYLMNRMGKLLGADYRRKLSPVNTTYSRMTKVTKFGRDQYVERWKICGISCVDYMVIYKKFCRNERESWSLDHISKIELNVGKVNINETSLAKLSLTDWNTFVDYNIQDVNLLRMLEEKLHYMEIMRMLAYNGLSPFESATGTVLVVTGAIASFAKRNGMYIPTFRVERNYEKYDGGYVKDIDSQLVENVVTFDANSLYPNTIITLNISPETKLGKIISKDDNFCEIVTVNGKSVRLKLADFKKFIKTKNVSVSSADVLFSQTKKGVIPLLTDELYAIRVEKKDAMNALEEKLAFKSGSMSAGEITSMKSKILDLDNLQYALKIFLNSMYGALATPTCALYDLDLAASITNTGQTTIKAAGDIIDRYINKTYDMEGSVVHYGDTDSCDSETLIRTDRGLLTIENLYDMFNGDGCVHYNKKEILKTNDLYCLTYNEEIKKEEYQKVKNLIRHKVSKKKYKIKCKDKFVIVTEDHSCMVLRDGILIETKPKDMLCTDKLITYNMYEDTAK